MARRKLPAEVDNDSLDMTPMIDIVFQLIIFFMLVTDMAKAQLEPLHLPVAKKAMKEKMEDPTILVLNIMKDGAIKTNGKVVWSPKMGDEAKTLENLFENRRNDRRYQEVAGKADWVKYPLLVRADRSTAFEHVQKVLMVAAHHGGVTRVQLGAKQEGKQ